MKMNYLNFFNMILDNNFLNCGILLSPIIKISEKQNVLENIAYRAQIEFKKEVVLVTNADYYKNSELKIINSSCDPYDVTKLGNSDYIIICDIIQTEENSSSWSTKIIELMEYYRVCFFGFSNRQTIRIYE